MTDPAQGDVIEHIHRAGKPFVLAVTGGGSSAIAALLEVPGASAVVLEAVVPYAPEALARWLGGPVDGACDERTARAMAMAAFERARELSGADPRSLRGIGATASLTTTQPKRGAHRVHVAWQSADQTAVVSCELAKGARNRAEEEMVARQLVLDVVTEACGARGQPLTAAELRAGLQRRRQQAPVAWAELLLGERDQIVIAAQDAPPAGAPVVLFPGAFDPLHTGHRRIAQIAAARLGAPVTFELSITNVDKRPLDFIELADRLAALAGERVLVTRAATFAEKARLVPGATFVVGADTISRIGDPRYYRDSAAHRDAAVAAIAEHRCRFLVFGRLTGGAFCTLGNLRLPGQLQALCDEVPEAEFRDDVSSTELRQQ